MALQTSRHHHGGKQVQAVEVLLMDRVGPLSLCAAAVSLVPLAAGGIPWPWMQTVSRGWQVGRTIT